jgi:large repetitive protein
MLQKNIACSAKFWLLQIFFALITASSVNAQVYQHDFGTTTITGNPYTGTPTVLHTDLSGSAWTRSAAAWQDFAGSTGKSLAFDVAPSGESLTLTFNVAPGNLLSITSFDFWRRRSNTGPQNWAMTINGIAVGTGTTPTTGATIGTTNVTNPVAGLSGTVTVVLSLTGSTGGTFRLDDFTLNGTVTSSCTTTVASFLPLTGPVGTMVTINGTNFTGTTAVKIGNINATSFTVLSNTQIQAQVPANAVSGTIKVTNGCEATSVASFSVLQSSCIGASGTEIYISELYDEEAGSGGIIELYNPTAATITFGGQYVLQRYGDINDATPTAGYILILPGSIAPGATYQVAATDPLECTVTSSAAMTAGFNGNDKFELLKNGVVIDVVNVPYIDPGYTLIRQANAAAPSAVYNSGDWNNSATENCSTIGSHIATPVTTPVVTQPVSQTVCENASTSFTVTVTPSAGFTYQWKVLNAAGIWTDVTNNANYSGATTATLTINSTPLSFDNNQYYCLVTSAACTIVSNAVQLDVVAAPVAPTFTLTQPTCTSPVGILVITNITAGITYSVNGNFGTAFTGLTPNTYTVTATNAAGCVTSASATINAAPSAPSVPTFTVTQPTCTTSTGTVTITNPVAGVTYSIGATTGTTFTGLAPNTYTVTATAGGCTSTASVTINAAPAAPAVPTFTITQPTCTTPTGTVVITNPVTGVTYSIGATTGTTFAGLAPNTYTVTATTAGGCTSTASVTINAAPLAPAVPTFTVTQPTCTTPTGTVTITNPVVGVTYSVGAITGTTFAGLTPNTYTVTATAGGCTSTASVTINAAPSAPSVPTFTVAQPTCTTPTGTVTITNPVVGVTYSVGAITGTTFADLTPNTYTVTATAGGCTSTASVTINAAPAAPAIPTFTVTQPTCTTPTGTVTITNPVAGVTYSIGATTGTALAGLTPNTYAVTATTAGGCTSTASVTINAAPAAPAVPTFTVTQPTCTTPTGTVAITNPVAGVTYSIGATTGTSFTGLAPNTYTVTATTAGGCTSTASATINAAPAAPAIPTFTVTQPTCTTPTGTVTITNPVAGVTYSIGAITGTAFTGLTPNTYTVTATSGGCTSTASVTINAAPSAPSVPTFTVTQPTCTTSTGTVTITNPVAGVTYSIGAITGTTFTGLAPNTYTVTATTAGGCTSTASVTINADGGLPLFVTNQGCEETIFGSNYVLSVGPMNASFDINDADIEWSLENGTVLSNNGFTFNVTQYVADNNIDISQFPLQIRATVITPAGCENFAVFVIENSFCNIPKGISPNNDTRNDNFNLTGMNIKKLSIFNRYGKDVYSKNDYTCEWFGQSDDNKDLPTGTYYYLIELRNGKTETGWVYINREI